MSTAVLDRREIQAGLAGRGEHHARRLLRTLEAEATAAIGHVWDKGDVVVPAIAAARGVHESARQNIKINRNANDTDRFMNSN